MWILPYVGRRHTLYSHRSTDECWHMLRDETQAAPLGWNRGGWRRVTRDPSIMRKLHDRTFKMFRLTPSNARVGPWYFYGEIRADHGGTIIQGDYAAPWHTKLGWYIYVAVYLVLVVFILFVELSDGSPVPVMSLNQDIPWIIFLVSGGAVLSFVCWWRNKSEQANERYIVSFLREFFVADEVSG